MWTLLAIRYYDAVDGYRALPISPPAVASVRWRALTGGQQAAAGAEEEQEAPAAKLFATVMPYCTGLPKVAALVCGPSDWPG